MAVYMASLGCVDGAVESIVSDNIEHVQHWLREADHEGSYGLELTVVRNGGTTDYKDEEAYNYISIPAPKVVEVLFTCAGCGNGTTMKMREGWTSKLFVTVLECEKC